VVGKVLQRVGVVDRLGRVRPGEVDTIGMVVGVMFDPSQTDAGEVEETVHEVGGEVVAGGRVDDVVTEGAELFVVFSVDVGEVADDGLFGGILSSPVTPPSVLDTV
jgi:hypothetical protein